MRQSFDQTFCCQDECINDKCKRYMRPETLAALPPYRSVSMDDFKTDTCGYRVGKDCEI